jgi:hypothetical protein
VFENPKSETADKERIDLISEEEWERYCKAMLADEEKTLQSETVYMENQYGGLRRCFKKV